MSHAFETEPVIGIDLGGTNLQAAVVGSDNTIAGRSHRPTNAAAGADAVIEAIVEASDEAADAANLRLGDIAAIGIAAPGAMDMPRGVVLDAPNLGWIDLPLRDILRDRFGKRVVLENDVNAAVWGEYASGERDVDDLLGAWVGTGLGGGLILGGRLHHGAFHTAGEIGQAILYPDEPRGQRIVEDYCSRVGLARLLGERTDDLQGSALATHFHVETGRLDTRGLAEAYFDGDQLARELMQRVAHLLGVTIANWVTALSLPRVVIGGGVTEQLGERWLDLVRASFSDAVFPDRCRDCELRMTRLAGDAGLIGAALLCRDRLEVRVHSES